MIFQDFLGKPFAITPAGHHGYHSGPVTGTGDSIRSFCYCVTFASPCYCSELKLGQYDDEQYGNSVTSGTSSMTSSSKDWLCKEGSWMRGGYKIFGVKEKNSITLLIG
ncbi:hypothetical protein TorRG33x02_175740 [Trema orientale]|uniref:Uncharacterized protein n=1 Tax=Trema orientale TaxID=63057 RepID=A0A2P5EM52_TREOI|nr:hypothetical protein TorRG33x02_175740 [Trema orientale]